MGSKIVQDLMWSKRPGGPEDKAARNSGPSPSPSSTGSARPSTGGQSNLLSRDEINQRAVLAKQQRGNLRRALGRGRSNTVVAGQAYNRNITPMYRNITPSSRSLL